MTDQAMTIRVHLRRVLRAEYDVQLPKPLADVGDETLQAAVKEAIEGAVDCAVTGYELLDHEGRTFHSEDAVGRCCGCFRMVFEDEQSEVRGHELFCGACAIEETEGVKEEKETERPEQI